MSTRNAKPLSNAWWTEIVRHRDSRILALEKQCEEYGKLELCHRETRRETFDEIARLTQRCGSLDILFEAKQVEVNQLLGAVERLTNELSDLNDILDAATTCLARPV